ncbi:MAG: cyclic nucleotide-binding domain-containing protein [Magnetococcales bacterium]|nr:cyclic nucleotide-binding domain-containing protein [Magnetococcales bacterium]MBF0438521.1 cyclic nucleotide-binding domain-containing protein [Magnetococcales bacterium]
MSSNLSLPQIIAFLSTVEGFCELPEQDLATLIAPLIGIETFERGQHIIQFGSVGTTLFVLYEGKARVDLPVGEGKMLHFSCDSGTLLGEMSLVSNKPRGADIVAETHVVVLTLDIETFQMLMSNDWRVTKAFASLIGRRLAPKEG